MNVMHNWQDPYNPQNSGHMDARELIERTRINFPGISLQKSTTPRCS